MVSNPGIYGVQPRRLRADAMDVARLSRDELRRLLLSRYVELPVFILDVSIIYHWDCYVYVRDSPCRNEMHRDRMLRLRTWAPEPPTN